MEPNDARSLLSKLSGIPDSELVGTVVQNLDYQPLALAGAAVFVKDSAGQSIHAFWVGGIPEDLRKRQKTENGGYTC